MKLAAPEPLDITGNETGESCEAATSDAIWLEFKYVMLPQDCHNTSALLCVSSTRVSDAVLGCTDTGLTNTDLEENISSEFTHHTRQTLQIHCNSLVRNVEFFEVVVCEQHGDRATVVERDSNVHGATTRDECCVVQHSR